MTSRLPILMAGFSRLSMNTPSSLDGLCAQVQHQEFGRCGRPGLAGHEAVRIDERHLVEDLLDGRVPGQVAEGRGETNLVPGLHPDVGGGPYVCRGRVTDLESHPRLSQ